MNANRLLSIVYAILVWVLGVIFYLASYYVPVLDNPELQANIVLAFAIIPCACFGTYLYYRKGHMKPNLLAFIFVAIAVLLDVLITVPVFILPSGGSYIEFFKNPMFYIIVVEFYLIVLNFGKFLTK